MISADLFREVFRRWPSGVAVLTARHAGQAHGMVVGSFCSLAADPPLVMVSAGRAGRSHDLIDTGGRFAVSILSEEQRALFDRFAGFDPQFDGDRFAGLTTVDTAAGLPIFPQALAWVDCHVVARHPGDGYTIFVAQVVDGALGEAAEAPPLVYFRRRPRHLVDHGV